MGFMNHWHGDRLVATHRVDGSLVEGVMNRVEYRDDFGGHGATFVLTLKDGTLWAASLHEYSIENLDREQPKTDFRLKWPFN